MSIQRISPDRLAAGRAVLRFNGSPGSILDRGTLLDPRVHTGAAHIEDAFTRIEEEIIETVYEPRDGLVLVPFNDSLDFGIKEIEYRQGERGGRPTLVEGIDPDIARSTVGVQRIKEEVYTFAYGFEVDVDELAESKMGSRPWNYVREQTEAVSEGLWEELDRCAINDGLAQFRGILGNKLGKVSDSYNLKGGGGGLFIRDSAGAIVHIGINSTADEMADGLLYVMHYVVENSNKAFKPNKLALSLRLRNKAARLRVGDTGMTVLQWVVENCEYLESTDDIVGVSKFEGYFAAEGDNPAYDVIFPFRHDRKSVVMEIMSPRSLAVMTFSFGQLVVWVVRTTNVLWKQPMACAVFSTNYNAS